MGDGLKFRGDMIVKLELAICRLQLLPQDELHDNNFIAQVIVSRRVHLRSVKQQLDTSSIEFWNY
jgi:hypothetical protein